MKKYITILFILIFCGSISLYSQTKIKIDDINAYKKADQETLFVHFNTSFLLAGERLYYKVYCLNSKTKILSNFSKIAYVELISSNSDIIFKHKIRLDSGLGQGDFFIPASILSGNYKLIAYTQWMRNGGENNFFQNEISIINPFNENQNEILFNRELTDTVQEFEIKDGVDTVGFISGKNSNELIQLKFEKKKFKSREKISLLVRNLKDKESFGNYSVSVRKIEEIKEPEKLTSKNYSFLFSESTNLKIKDSIYLPELRGELLSGKVVFLDSNKIASNVKVALSIPGRDYVFKIANTNDQGIFYFNIAEEYSNSKATIQVISNGGKNFEIMLDKHLSFKYEDLEFNKFWISQKTNDVILKHSVFNQIENAYSNVKQDTIYDIKQIVPFFGSNFKDYILDDYTRFPTIKETFIEIVDLVFISKKNGVNSLNVVGIKASSDSGFWPLVLLDGLIILDIDELLRFNAKKVKKISVLTEKYIYGSQLFEGVISIETNDSDYQNSFSEDFIKNVELFKPLPIKNYFNQMYDGSNKLARIPDYRNQLLWKPNFIINNREKNIITFFSSDNVGYYEISFEGFTNEGIPISLKEVFSVEN